MNDYAFPLAVPLQFQHFHEGMSLRQYYAVKMAQGLLAGDATRADDPATLASSAVTLADALIAELEPTP